MFHDSYNSTRPRACCPYGIGLGWVFKSAQKPSPASTAHQLQSDRPSQEEQTAEGPPYNLVERLREIAADTSPNQTAFSTDQVSSLRELFVRFSDIQIKQITAIALNNKPESKDPNTDTTAVYSPSELFIPDSPFASAVNATLTLLAVDRDENLMVSLMVNKHHLSTIRLEPCHYPPSFQSDMPIGPNQGMQTTGLSDSLYKKRQHSLDVLDMAQHTLQQQTGLSIQKNRLTFVSTHVEQSHAEHTDSMYAKCQYINYAFMLSNIDLLPSHTLTTGTPLTWIKAKDIIVDYHHLDPNGEPTWLLFFDNTLKKIAPEIIPSLRLAIRQYSSVEECLSLECLQPPPTPSTSSEHSV